MKILEMLDKIKKRKYGKCTSFIRMGSEFDIRDEKENILFSGTVYSFVEDLMKECNIELN